METVLEDLNQVRQHQKQIKQLEYLIVDWVSASAEENQDIEKYFKKEYKCFLSEQKESRSKEYLHGLEAESEALHQVYQKLEKQLKQRQEEIELYKALSGFEVGVTAIDRDETIDTDILKYNLNRGPKGSAPKQTVATGEYSDIHHFLKLDGKDFQLGIQKDRESCQRELDMAFLKR